MLMGVRGVRRELAAIGGEVGCGHESCRGRPCRYEDEAVLLPALLCNGLARSILGVI